jgi:hypothetical protein
MIFPLFLLIAIPAALLIGSVILRAAVNFANRRLGPARDSVVPSADEDDWADYPIPGDRTPPSTTQIPMPTVGGGMVMTFSVLIVNIIVAAVIQFVIGDDPAPRHFGFRGPLADGTFIARILTLPANFLVTAGLLAAMLPTTFRRGCLVTFFCCAICIGFGGLFLVPIWLLRL